jgi:tRNA-dihydrouridine synthase B
MPLSTFINNPLHIGALQLNHRLIQGPLAGYSCAPFRTLFSRFKAPAFCVSEMLSAQDVLFKHPLMGRYLYRDPTEKILSYQISGNNAEIMANAAAKLEALGADLIDINCGCPKTKIRKKGAGSALLDQPEQLLVILKTIRAAISCPLTVKIRLNQPEADLEMAKKIADSGADALIIHGRNWQDDYSRACDWAQIGRIKNVTHLPIIVNGDIHDEHSLNQAWNETGGDAFMISRAATGKPWLFQELLDGHIRPINITERIALFCEHLTGLAQLESEHQAILQSRSLVRYYFKSELSLAYLADFYKLLTLSDIEFFLQTTLSS